MLNLSRREGWAWKRGDQAAEGGGSSDEQGISDWQQWWLEQADGGRESRRDERVVVEWVFVRRRGLGREPTSTRAVDLQLQRRGAIDRRSRGQGDVPNSIRFQEVVVRLRS